MRLQVSVSEKEVNQTEETSRWLRLILNCKQIVVRVVLPEYWHRVINGVAEVITFPVIVFLKNQIGIEKVSFTDKIIFESCFRNP